MASKRKWLGAAFVRGGGTRVKGGLGPSVNNWSITHTSGLPRQVPGWM